MNKTFLILGVIGSLCVTNAFAARVASTGVDETYKCPAGCTPDTPMVLSTSSSGGDGSAQVIITCHDANGNLCKGSITENQQSAVITSKTARAAKISTQAKNSTSVAQSSKEEMVEKAAGGVLISCPKGCKGSTTYSDDGSVNVRCVKKTDGTPCELGSVIKSLSSAVEFSID